MSYTVSILPIQKRNLVFQGLQDFLYTVNILVFGVFGISYMVNSSRHIPIVGNYLIVPFIHSSKD